MNYYSYHTYKTDPCIDSYVKTVSEEEILKEYWDFWKEKMIKKYGSETFEKNFTKDDCIYDWCVVHWAWKA